MANDESRSRRIEFHYLKFSSCSTIKRKHSIFWEIRICVSAMKNKKNRFFFFAQLFHIEFCFFFQRIIKQLCKLQVWKREILRSIDSAKNADLFWSIFFLCSVQVDVIVYLTSLWFQKLKRKPKKTWLNKVYLTRL